MRKYLAFSVLQLCAFNAAISNISCTCLFSTFSLFFSVLNSFGQCLLQELLFHKVVLLLPG
jgi:hypothetical protein